MPLASTATLQWYGPAALAARVEGDRKSVV